MKKMFVLLVLINLVLPVFGQTPPKPRLGILPFTGGTGGDGETIATLFSFQDEILEAFTVVPRTSAVNALVAEQSFQLSGYTDSDTIARLGRMLNADFVISGRIHRLGHRNLVITTIVDVESFEQLGGDYREYRTIEEVPGMMADIAHAVINASRRDTSALPNLAVVPFHLDGRGVNVEDAESLVQILSIEIANSGKYTVLPRTTAIQAALQALDFQMTGATAEEEAKALGRAINAQYVLNAEVRSLGTMNMFTASILNVEDGSLLLGGFRNYRTVADGISLMAELASVLTGVAASPAPAQQTIAEPRAPRPERSPRPVRERPETDNAALNSIGVSAGTSFATPAFIGTVSGTVAPARNMFFEFGLDVGLIYTGQQGDDFTVDSYYSLYPFANLGFFVPFTGRGGWYAGIGGGYMFGEYTFNDGRAGINIFAFNLTTGFLIGNVFNISYTLRTNFEGTSNKVSAGYTYRFGQRRR
jgi:TolB-like protein